MVFKVYNTAGRTVFTEVDQLPMKKLMQIDNRAGEEIVCRPAFDEQNRVKGLFLNNLPEEALEHLPNGTIIVETSAGKYQAHIPLPELLEEEKAKALQSTLVDYYQSDVEAKALLHLRHLPGFTNKKYEEQPVAKVIRIIQNDLDFLKLIEEIKANNR